MPYKILLLDDDTDDRMFFKDAIREIDNNVSCITLADGHELIATLKGDPDNRPDVIFLDINMPGMSGWDVLSLLKDHDSYREIPIIMYSTSKHTEEVTKSKSLGALCFFNKPSSFTILKNALKTVIEHLKNNSLEQLCHSSEIFV